MALSFHRIGRAHRGLHGDEFGTRRGSAPAAKRRAEAKRRTAEDNYFASRCKAATKKGQSGRGGK